MLTETIFKEAQQAKINVTLSARFLAGKHNTEADRLSRLNAYSCYNCTLIYLSDS